VGLPASQFAVESLVSGFDSNSFSTSVAEESFSYTRKVHAASKQGHMASYTTELSTPPTTRNTIGLRS
jgi:hypothetical protein